MIKENISPVEVPNQNPGFSLNMLPKTLKRVILHCRGYSCLAVSDENGVWRNPFNGAPINAFIVDWEPI